MSLQLKTSLILRAIIITVLCVLVSCKQTDNKIQSQNKNAWIQVLDSEENNVILKSPAKRIISLAPHIVENLFSVGLGDRIIGTVEYSDFPEPATSIPIIGKYNAYSLEKIISLHPDLIVAWSSGMSPQVIEQIKSLGIPLYLDNPKTLNEISTSLHNFAKLGNTTDIGEQRIEELKSKIKNLSERYSKKELLSVFIPLSAKPIRTLGGKQIISNVLELCGGKNIFHDLFEVAPIVNIESVIQRGADVILIGAKSHAELENQLKNLDLPETNNSIDARISTLTPTISIHPDLLFRHTLRLVDGATEICKQLDSIRMDSIPKGNTSIENHIGTSD